MKNLFALVCLALLVMAGAAQAAAPGLNLSWANCATTAASGDKTYACDGALGNTVSFQGTFRPGTSIADFAGVTSIVDFGFASTVPDYWKTEAGACNAGSLTAGNPTSTAPCVTPNIFDPTASGGGFALNSPSPSRIRMRVDWATGATVPPSVTAGLLYPAFRVTFDPDAGFNAGCAGCTDPGCMVFNSAEVFGFLPGEDYFMEAVDVRQFITWQGGAVGGAGCPAIVPTQSKTWGSIKAMYR